MKREQIDAITKLYFLAVAGAKAPRRDTEAFESWRVANPLYDRLLRVALGDAVSEQSSMAGVHERKQA